MDNLIGFSGFLRRESNFKESNERYYENLNKEMRQYLQSSDENKHIVNLEGEKILVTFNEQYNDYVLTTLALKYKQECDKILLVNFANRKIMILETNSNNKFLDTSKKETQKINRENLWLLKDVFSSILKQEMSLQRKNENN